MSTRVGANIAVFQGAETVLQGENLRRHLGQRPENSDLDSANLHAAGQNAAHTFQCRMAIVQLHAPAAPTTVCL